MNNIFKVEYYADGQWNEITDFERPLCSSEDVTEVMDSGNITFINTEYLNIPLFAPIRITMTDTDTGVKLTEYYVKAMSGADASRMT